jgi:hypothetical protein
VVVAVGSETQCLNTNNEVYRFCSTGLLVNVQEMLLCMYLLHIDMRAECGT